MGQALTIGNVARVTGVTAKTIRYYEAIGVVPVPGRTSAGYRRYQQPDIERLRFVSRARSLGLPLDRLRMLASALDGDSPAPLPPRLLRLVREQLAAVRRQMGELERLRQQLERVSHRMRRRNQRRRVGPCRCLDTDDQSPRRQPAHRSSERREVSS